MRRANSATIKNSLVRIVVTGSTRIERELFRAKLRSLMLSMTINTTDSRSRMRLDRRSNEGISMMTRSATLLHVAAQRMTACTRTRIRLDGNCGRHRELRRSMRLRNRSGSECARVSVSRCNRNQTDNQKRPREKRDRPARHQIAGRHPVELRLTAAPAALRIKW